MVGRWFAFLARPSSRRVFPTAVYGTTDQFRMFYIGGRGGRVRGCIDLGAKASEALRCVYRFTNTTRGDVHVSILSPEWLFQTRLLNVSDALLLPLSLDTHTLFQSCVCRVHGVSSIVSRCCCIHSGKLYNLPYSGARSLHWGMCCLRVGNHHEESGIAVDEWEKWEIPIDE